MTTTLTDFLLERIAEDEGYARRASEDSASWGEPSSGVLDVGELHALGDSGLSRHIARHDPARVLAECEAKRRIVDLHGGDYDGECQSPAHLDGPCRTLRAVAFPYADHPDYNEEWKP